MIKRKYITPALEEIRIDNEISLQLASKPTIDTGLETYGTTNMEEENYSYENW